MTRHPFRGSTLAMPARRVVCAATAAAIAAALATAASPALAKGRPATVTLSDVLARAKTANDVLPSSKTIVEDWDGAADGLSGTQVVVRRGHDYTVTTRLGPFLTEHGRAGA